ncbi:family 20 glycosylhydrolase [Shewanella sp. UCD-KL12]|uniref:family 20 glycosylhydrolase n=1 Tax=Shewanella sp. UCD-KL12 TaxID=1917163 RepID=UPI000970D319|nr:family 20 glycosylhydrolase [Shewanella sp. UCD-KL12]
MHKKILISLFTLLSASSHAVQTDSAQQSLQQFASQLMVKHEFVDSHPQHCPNDLDECYLSKIHLQTPQDTKVGVKDWGIYFSQLTPVQLAHSDEFTITHINGDLHRIAPTEQFSGFKANQALSISFYSYGTQITRSEFMPNYFVHAEGLSATVIDSTRTGIDAETGLETQDYLLPFTDKVAQFKLAERDNTPWASPEYIYASTASVPKSLDVSDSLIPQPQSVKTLSKENLDLTNGLALKLQGVSAKALNPAIARLNLLGVNLNPKGLPLTIRVDNTLDIHDEGYRFTSQNEQISILAKTDTGAFYGLISLAGLITLDDKRIPSIEIVDAPRYKFRGMHIDVARNFLSKAFIFKTLEQMAAYKLNKLHLHLADDEGWRIEIPGLPELSQVGAKRCFNAPDRCLMPQLGSDISGESQSDGYYSVDDYQAILAFAKARHIQVIPSLDMPGHSRAAIHSMEARYQKYLAEGKTDLAQQYRLVEPADNTQYSSIQHYSDNTLNVCLDSTYAFIDKVIAEVQTMHQQAGTPLTTYHIGADETAGAWLDSPACNTLKQEQAEKLSGLHTLNGYFIERISAMLADKKIKVAGWNDGMGETRPNNMPQQVQTNSWSLLFEKGHVATHQQANYHWDTVISTPEVTYFDFPYQAHPEEPGNHWGARAISTRKVFEFMPDNLPAHAEFWFDTYNLAYTADDRQTPLAQGVRYKGLQGHLWSEMLRSDRQAEYMLFPRLLALAERAWHKADWELNYDYSGQLYDSNSQYFTESAVQARESDWQRFASILGQKELAKLEQANVFYRIPTVGAKVEQGYLQVKMPYPNIAVEYQPILEESSAENPANSEEKPAQWLPYTRDSKVKGPIKIRAMSLDGQRKGRAQKL